MQTRSVAKTEREARFLKGLGSPTPMKVHGHNVAHLPFRSWCPALVSGKARGLQHRRNEEQEDQRIAEIVFDWVLGRGGGREDDSGSRCAWPTGSDDIRPCGFPKGGH